MKYNNVTRVNQGKCKRIGHIQLLCKKSIPKEKKDVDTKIVIKMPRREEKSAQQLAQGAVRFLMREAAVDG